MIIAVICATLAASVRLLLLQVYGPVAYSDTPSYRRLAEAVLNGFQRYDGTRTPGYPIFLALVGGDQQVYIVQLMLGFLTTLLLFWIGWRLTQNAWVAGAMGLAHSLNLGQLFFEANLLTETLSTFFLVLAMAGMLLHLTRRKQTRVWLAAGIGLAASLAALTRPVFIYLPFWLGIIAIVYLAHPTSETQPSGVTTQSPINTWWRGIFTRRALLTGTVLLVPAVLILGSWVWFIHTRYHMWSLSTMTGYHMIQHTGNFFEYLPDDYADLRDTYLEFRQAHIAEYGTQTNTIWEAIPAMQKVSGLTFYDLSRTLSKLSGWLILHHPGLYLSNVIKGWWLFWRAPVYWQPDAFDWQILAKIAQPVVLVERGLLFAANLVFVLTSLPVLWIKRLMPAEIGRRVFIWCLVGTVWIGSILQSLVDHGDNPRFLVPMQSLVVLWFFWLAYQIWHFIRKEK